MYVSPINIVETAMTDIKDAFEKSIEENCFKVAYKYGIDINKEELIAALKADRKRYEEAYNRGYSAGRRAAFDELETYKNTGMWEVPNDDRL